MKIKLSLSIVLVLCTTYCFSQKKYLAEYSSDVQKTVYSYNSNDKIEKLSQASSIETRAEYFYNNNNLERLDFYQVVKDEWTKVYYIDYTYDAKNNLSSRTNYNVDLKSGEFSLGGVTRYDYNENNQLALTTIYMKMNKKEVPYERKSYIYEKNLLKSCVSENADPYEPSPEWFVYSTRGYLYDSSDRLVVDSVINVYGENNVELATKTEFIYDSNGNLDRYNYYIPGNSTIWSMQIYHTYEYDLSLSAKEYILPIDQEDREGNIYFTMNNERNKEYFYARDDKTKEFGLAETYTYKYQVASSIENNEVSSNYIYPNPVENSFTVNFPTNGMPLFIYDAQGKLVVSYNKINSVVEVPNLSSGTYYIKCGNISVKMIKK